METLTSTIWGAQPGWWMDLLDLKDACINVIMKVISFNLGTSPSVFTKRLLPVAVHLHWGRGGGGGGGGINEDIIQELL